MDLKLKMLPVLLVVVLGGAVDEASAQVAPPTSGSAAAATVSRVRGTPVFYERQGDSFRRMVQQPSVGKLDGMVVREISSRGYVLVSDGNQDWWVARSLVVIDGGDEQAVPRARCQNLLSVGIDTRTAGVRGAGEGCGK